MIGLFNFVIANSVWIFLVGAVCVILVIYLLVTFLDQHIETERRKKVDELFKPERLEAERKKQEAERKKQEAERRKRDEERREAERQLYLAECREAKRRREMVRRGEAERFEAERKKQAERLEAERFEAERKKQAERKQQVTERKTSSSQPLVEPAIYWAFANSEYNKFKTHKGNNASDIAARKEIAERILKLPYSGFTQAELDKQYKLMRSTYILDWKAKLNLDPKTVRSYFDLLKTAYDELCDRAMQFRKLP